MGLLGDLDDGVGGPNMTPKDPGHDGEHASDARGRFVLSFAIQPAALMSVIVDVAIPLDVDSASASAAPRECSRRALRRKWEKVTRFESVFNFPVDLSTTVGNVTYFQWFFLIHDVQRAAGFSSGLLLRGGLPINPS